MVLQGTWLSFVPVAEDQDHDALSFAIQNAPPWATFDTSTGELRGLPGLIDLGTYADIRISVSDGEATVALAPFGIEVVASAVGSATLSWLAPTQRTDGSPLNDLAGFTVYWGTSLGSYPNSATITNPGVATYVVDQLTPATWFFVVTAVDSSGRESSFSNVASKAVL